MPGSFSGNGSVKWMVEVNNKIGTPENEDKGGGRHYQAGRDRTDRDRYFKVTIKCPRNGDQWRSFVERLTTQAQIAQASFASASTPITYAPHGQIELWVPIEDVDSFGSGGNSTDDQIHVDWPLLP